MARQFQYVSLDRIISKIYRDLGLEEISETDVIEWAGEALEGIGAITLYEQAVAFIEVDCHKAKFPNNFHSVIQISRNNKWSKEELCPASILADANKSEIATQLVCNKNTGITDAVPLDCNGTPIIGYDVAYYRPYFDLQYEYNGWSRSNYYKKYSPVRLSNHSFFNSVVCQEDEELYRNCSDEYTISGDNFVFSFKEGSVAVAYNRQVVDSETGYPMIPDDYSIITAITMYITMKYMGRMWYTGREGFADKFQKAEQDWQWYCKQAGNTLLMPYGEDQHQQQLEGRLQMIPNHNKYYSNFSNLGTKQNNNWNR